MRCIVPTPIAYEIAAFMVIGQSLGRDFAADVPMYLAVLHVNSRELDLSRRQLCRAAAQLKRDPGPDRRKRHGQQRNR